MSARTLTALCALLVLGACSASATESGVSQTATTNPTSGSPDTPTGDRTAEGCEPGRELPYPVDGRFDLNGVWLSQGIDIYYISQVDDAVWYVAMSGPEAELGIGRAFTTLFKGTLSGTTITGDYIYSTRGILAPAGEPRATGSHTFELGQDQNGNVTLTRTSDERRDIVPCTEAAQ